MAVRRPTGFPSVQEFKTSSTSVAAKEMLGEISTELVLLVTTSDTLVYLAGSPFKTDPCLLVHPVQMLDPLQSLLPTATGMATPEIRQSFLHHSDQAHQLQLLFLVEFPLTESILSPAEQFLFLSSLALFIFQDLPLPLLHQLPPPLEATQGLPLQLLKLP